MPAHLNSSSSSGSAAIVDPARRPFRSPAGRIAVRLLLLVAAYFVSGRLGLMLPYVGSNITLIWLPTGIAVAALLRWGWGYWPGVWLGALLVNLAVGSSIEVSAGIAVGNTLAPLFSALILRLSGFHAAFDRQRDVALLVLAAGAGMLLSATGGVASLRHAGLVSAADASAAWTIWWLGDCVGVLLAAPPLLTMRPLCGMSLSRFGGEKLVWCLLAGFGGWIAFLSPVNHDGQAMPMVFLTLPLIVWAALRFGVTGASVAVLILSGIAAWGAANGRGPFNLADAQMGLLLLWAYMVSSVLVGLLITALQAERWRAEAAIQAVNERLTGLVEAIPDAIFFKDGDGRWLITNEPAKRLFRLHDIDWQGRSDRELAALRPEFRAAHELCLRDDELAWEARQLALFDEGIVGEDGVCHEFEVRKVPTFSGDGGRKGLIIIGRDVSEDRRVQREVERMSRRNELLLMAAGEGIFGVDGEGCITFINPAALRMLGFASDDVIGRHRHRLFHFQRIDGRAYPEAECPIERTLRDGVARHDDDEWFMCKDGHGFPVALTVSPINEDGRLSGAVVTFQDVSQRRAAEAEIHRLAFYDPLTQLPNRRLLHDRLGQALAACARRGANGAILFLDLDNFKTINDTVGHDVGDLLLVEVARRLTASVRAEDTVARLGGDEFVVMLENLSDKPEEAAAQAEGVSEKIRLALNQPYWLQGREHFSSTSIGISMFRTGGENGDELLKHADVALYKAKAAGRNTVRFFDPAMQAALDARAVLETELRAAIRLQQFRLHFQLQVGNDKRILGAEVLLRWQHPARGLVAPADFIPLAEESGLIVPIGAWVLEATCLRLKAWEASPATRNLPLAVNISARQFRQGDFVEQVRETLARTGADPCLLKLELTESLVLHNVDDVVEKMQALKALGVGFSMDDFGTGYSSLAYLKQLPFDQLKIDQSFIRHLSVDAGDAAIVKTIIGIARGMGLNVIAEGVETEVQHEFLEAYGCPAFQGYLFSHPVPLAEFERLVA